MSDVTAADESASGAVDEEGPAVLVLSGHRTEKLVDPLETTGEDVTTVTNTADGLVGRFVGVLRDGIRHARSEEVDVVVGDHGGVVGFAAAVIGTLFGLTVLIRIGGEIWQINREKAAESRADGEYGQYALITAFRVMNWFTFRRADGFLVLTDHLAMLTVQETGCDPRDVRVVGVPIDVDAYQRASGDDARETLGIEESTVVTTVTNLRFRGKYEGVRRTLPAVERLLDAHPDCAFVVAGDGRYREQVLADVNERFDAETRERVYVPGFVDDVRSLYAASTVVCYVSFIDGFGNVVREGQAAGKPVVTNDGYGMREQVDDGVTGVLVDPDPDAVFAAVDDLLTDPDRRAALGRAGLESVTERGDSERVGREIYAAITDLVRRAR